MGAFHLKGPIEMSAQMSDRQALCSLFGCIFSVVALVAVAAVLTATHAWPMIGTGVLYVLHAIITVVMVGVNLLNVVAIPLLCLASFGFVVSLCLMGKGFHEHPGEGAAPWRVWLGENLEGLPVALFLVFGVSLFPALWSAGHGSDVVIADYSKVVSVPRDDLGSVKVDSYTNWKSVMILSGAVERNSLRSVCQSLVGATPADSPYALTINGKPASQNGCGWGANYLVWQEK